MTWESPAGISALFCQKRCGFGKGKKEKVLWGCSVLAVILVLWMERNRRMFEVLGEGVEEFWKRVRLGSALWASATEALKANSFSCVLLDLKAAVI